MAIAIKSKAAAIGPIIQSCSACKAVLLLPPDGAVVVMGSTGFDNVVRGIIILPEKPVDENANFYNTIES